MDVAVSARGQPPPGSADVLIAGGGPAGCATALALLRAGRSVVLLERAAHLRQRAGEVLPPLARPTLESLGLLERFHDQHHLPAYALRCLWGGEQPYDIDLTFHPYGPGWHLDRSGFDRMLRDAVGERGGHVIAGTSVRALRAAGDGSWRAELSGKGGTHQLSVGFVVDATGRAGALARRLGGRRRSYDSLVGLVGISVPAPNALPARVVTLIEAAPDGWWYAGRLPGGAVVAALMTDTDLLPAGRSGVAARWAASRSSTMLVSRIWPDAAPASLQVLRAETGRLERVAGRGWLAVGDAAMSLDPLSSQGICAALDAGERAGLAVERALSDDHATLDGYAADSDRIFADYVTLRSHYYRRESRWPSSPFWRRRQQPVPLGH